METMRRDPGQGPADDDDKLIPEWGADRDDQIIWAGLAVFAIAVVVVFGWNRWFGGDGDPVEVGPAAALQADATGSALADGDLLDGAVAAPATAAAPPTTAAPTTTSTTTSSTTTSSTPTTAPTTVPTGPSVGQLDTALASAAGAITTSLDGADVTLTGFVADDIEEAAAIDAAAAVAGVESVTSELVLLEPAVIDVLADQGVVGATAEGIGTEVAVGGTLQAETDRGPTIAAAAAVAGVTAVVDELEVSVADALNELPTIPFATASARILADGRTVVADAAGLLADAPADATFEVQGYTDTVGDAAANRALSEARAEAVVAALVDAGIDPTSLTAIGFGETDRFAQGTSADALAANRIVRFVQTG